MTEQTISHPCRDTDNGVTLRFNLCSLSIADAGVYVPPSRWNVEDFLPEQQQETH